mmetsp:Transcript_50742/g.100962  ORF Transcript_50742/g.100962 Transcript_50742/m.100962 type:complete len:274 (-) Transcript_50742:1299-2120(-)
MDLLASPWRPESRGPGAILSTEPLVGAVSVAAPKTVEATPVVEPCHVLLTGRCFGGVSLTTPHCWPCCTPDCSLESPAAPLKALHNDAGCRHRGLTRSAEDDALFRADRSRRATGERLACCTSCAATSERGLGRASILRVGVDAPIASEDRPAASDATTPSEAIGALARSAGAAAGATEDSDMEGSGAPCAATGPRRGGCSYLRVVEAAASWLELRPAPPASFGLAPLALGALRTSDHRWLASQALAGFRGALDRWPAYGSTSAVATRRLDAR